MGRAQIFSDDHGDQIAVVTNFVDGDKILIVNTFQMLMGRQLQSRIDAVEMFPIDHAQDTRHVQRFR